MSDPTTPPTLATTTIGQGPPLVTLHASGLTGRQFARFAKEASAHYTVVSPDLLGTGASPLPPEFSLAVEVEAVLALLSAATSTHGAPSFVFGHSWGGLVALEAAMRAPHLFRGLCLFEPVIVFLAARSGSDEAKAEVAAISGLMQTPLDDGGRRWVGHFVDWWNGPGFFAAMSPTAQQAHIDTAPQSHRQVSCNEQATLTVENLAGLAVPTLFLVGETSPKAVRESARIAARAMPAATVEVIGGAGHMGPLTHGPTVNAAAIAFFDRLSQGE